MGFLQANILLAAVCAFTFYAAGKAEAKDGRPNHGLLWSGLSAVTSAVLIKLFGAGAVLVLLGQAVLFVGIGVFRAKRER